MHSHEVLEALLNDSRIWISYQPFFGIKITPLFAPFWPMATRSLGTRHSRCSCTEPNAFFVSRSVAVSIQTPSFTGQITPPFALGFSATQLASADAIVPSKSTSAPCGGLAKSGVPCTFFTPNISPATFGFGGFANAVPSDTSAIIATKTFFIFFPLVECFQYVRISLSHAPPTGYRKPQRKPPLHFAAFRVTLLHTMYSHSVRHRNENTYDF